MKKGLALPLMIAAITILSLAAIFSYKLNHRPTVEECLQKQKKIYKPGWEGEPTRQTNKCERLVHETNDARILDRLADSADIPTVIAVAQNQNSNSDTLTKIYKKSFEQKWQDSINWNLASNHQTDPSILDELSKISNSEYDTTKLNVAKNPSTSADTLKYLFENYRKHNILSAIATNTNAPPDLLRSIENEVANIEELPFKGEDEIHINLAYNPNTPADVLVKLLKEKGSTSVIWNYKDNIVRIDKEILSLEDYYIENFENGQSNYYRLIYDLAKNQNTSNETLQIILVRYGTLANVSFSSEGKSETIAEAAKRNLN